MIGITIGKDLSGKKSNPALTLDQQTVLERLSAIRDSIWFSVAGYALLTQNPTKSAIRDYSVVLANSGLTVIRKDEPDSQLDALKQRVNFLEDVSEPAAREVVERILGVMISDSFDLVLEFATKNRVLGKLHREEWFLFAKHYRNAVAHGNKWHFKSEKGFPVEWRKMTLVHPMHGKPITGFLKWFDGLQLGSQMAGFVQSSVNL
ncbi:hypothetical protein [Elongatibacter sediminis]|uniref:Uncharacterized protein n=1 Tax=Elongatibacter sediminis TaxID=3119006 RepID=A0AAW9RLM7_9GAMM